MSYSRQIADAILNPSTPPGFVSCTREEAKRLAELPARDGGWSEMVDQGMNQEAREHAAALLENQRRWLRAKAVA